VRPAGVHPPHSEPVAVPTQVRWLQLARVTCRRVAEVLSDDRVEELAKGVKAPLIARDDACGFHHAMATVVNANLNATSKANAKCCLPVAQPLID